MKIIVMDSGLGGKYFIHKLKKVIEIKSHFVKLFDDMVSTYSKNYVREHLLKIIDDNSSNNIKSIIIACHSASSCILDILMKHNFMLNNITIYEPIIPMCLYIKEKKYKNILILSTPLTEKIRWHQRLLESNNVTVKYITFPLLAKQLEYHTNYDESIDRLKKQQDFIKKCDCVVLGCTHYNIIKHEISNELKTKYNFKGVVLNSNDILLKYYKNNKIENIIL
jgi:glutamate racemase